MQFKNSAILNLLPCVSQGEEVTGFLLMLSCFSQVAFPLRLSIPLLKSKQGHLTRGRKRGRKRQWAGSMPKPCWAYCPVFFLLGFPGSLALWGFSEYLQSVTVCVCLKQVREWDGFPDEGGCGKTWWNRVNFLSNAFLRIWQVVHENNCVFSSLEQYFNGVFYGSRVPHGPVSYQNHIQRKCISETKVY